MKSQNPWWKGKRGEWYVVAQMGLFFMVFFGPLYWLGWPTWSSPASKLAAVVGSVILLSGSLLFISGILRLGANLTALPYPKSESTLIVTGPYQIVRHPMYSGAILAAFGWALLIQSWLAIVIALVLFILFDLKSRREEAWLKEKFPDYVAYQQRVRKLVPLFY
jgi:protein-S-isoprenylcysteine O-methyltransferase Ste14